LATAKISVSGVASGRAAYEIDGLSTEHLFGTLELAGPAAHTQTLEKSDIKA